ncbi:MAG: zinc ABC transporter substrate-binding protein [Bacteroidales bacterium]|jgi:zinc transport system substrate-binding protein|nr:zinc ABC transporter substrate-binding protein [Bacteroidales bacterium]
MKKILLLFVLTLYLFGCSFERKPNEKEMISVSLVPQKYFVEQIVGDDFDIHIVIPPGASHAEFDPTPSDLAKITKSVAYFCMGNIGFEHHLVHRISELHPESQFFDLSKNVFLIDAAPHRRGDHQHYNHNNKDSHTWMSARNGKIIAQNIYDAVSQLKPERKSFYQENLIRFQQSLDSLDNVTRQKLSHLSTRAFVIFHPALTYYAENYDLEQIPLEIDGKEPSVTWMSQVVKMIEERNVKLVFTQGEYSQASAKAIAETTNIELQEINPLSENWKEEFELITNIIAEKMGSEE